jgi:mannose/fructose/N-acetylgalactosamine-specific phosphotransferase system component IIB
MALVLVRIDDRLIHGQVVLGWARILKPERVVVANDRVAGNDWERRLYTASVPQPLKAAFLTVDEAAAELRAGGFAGERTVLLFESVADVHRSAAAGALFGEVNVGGLHFREGTRAVLPFVYLSEEDRQRLRELIAQGAKFVARDIPGNPAFDLGPLITQGVAGPSGGV